MWGLLLAAVVPVLAAVRMGPHASRAPALTASLIALAAWCVGVGVSTGNEAVGAPPSELLAVAVAGCLWLGSRQWTGEGRSWLLPVSITVAAAVAVLTAGPYWNVQTPFSAPAAIAAGFALLTAPQVITDLVRGGQLRSHGVRAALVLAVFGPIAAATGFAFVNGIAQFTLHPVAYLPLAGALTWLVTSRGVGATGMAAISEPIIFVDSQGQVVDGNPAAFELLGVATRNPQMLHRQVMGVPGLRRLLEDPTRECGEFFTGTTVGDRRCYEARVLRSAGESGEVRVLSVQDVTSRRESERQLFHQAHFDSLTGLANRRYFLDRLEDAVEGVQGSNDADLAVMYIDLDRFKEINDTFGHAAGDELLRTMAHRLRQHLRVSDLVSAAGVVPSAPTVARLGGDEFALVLTGIGEAELAEKVAERILALLSEPVILDGKKVWAAGSVGIALYPQHGTDAQQLLRSADIALYHAKANHRSSFQFFRPELMAETQRKAALDRHLRGAMDSGELELHFQPKVDVASNELTGAEALLRWRNAELGTVAPKEFIPVAEDFGLIGPIGTWVIENVCEHLNRWRAAGLPIVPVSINVSPQQFTQMDLTATIASALESYDLPPSWLEVELTESVILEQDDNTTSALRTLQTIGVRIALDDFGTGYSSLSYLNRVPLDVLKMDRNFVRDIHLDPGAEGVVSAVISMAHSLSLEVIAEGVDCDEQIEILQRMGCDQIQGFVFGPAVSENEFTQILRAGNVPLASEAKGESDTITGTPLEEIGSDRNEFERTIDETAAPGDEIQGVADAGEAADDELEVDADVSGVAPELETDPDDDEASLPAIFGEESASNGEANEEPDVTEMASEESVETATAAESTLVAADDDVEAPEIEADLDDDLPAPFQPEEGPVALTGATSTASSEQATSADEVTPEALVDVALEGETDAAEDSTDETADAAELVEPAETELEVPDTVVDLDADGSEPVTDAAESAVAEVASDAPETHPDASETEGAHLEDEPTVVEAAEDGEGAVAAEDAPDASERSEDASVEAAVAAEADGDVADSGEADTEEADTEGDVLAASASESEATDGDAAPAFTPYCLVVDDGSDRLGLLAMRMNRIGALALYARVYDEGLLFVAQEGEAIRSVMVSTTAPVEEVRRLAERIASDAGVAPSILLVGPGEAPKELLDLRGRCRIWGVREPIDDALLGHLLGAVHLGDGTDTPAVQRERPRAPYDIMASVETSEGSEAVLLSSLSDRGAFLEMSKPPEVTATLDLEFTLEEMVVGTVGKVLYRIEGDDARTGGVGVEFVGLDADTQERIAAAVDERAVRCLA
ncbi:MAG: EAL domain-containing protein [Myxococcota bacterium]